MCNIIVLLLLYLTKTDPSGFETAGKFLDSRKRKIAGIRKSGDPTLKGAGFQNKPQPRTRSDATDLGALSSDDDEDDGK
jgi:hypothetical protein